MTAAITGIALIQESATFEEFLDIVINHLWQITERNLCEIKKIIKNEIAQDYNNAFEELKVAISKIRNKTQLRDLQQKIAEASTDMPNTLDKICYWFQRSTESKHNWICHCRLMTLRTQKVVVIKNPLQEKIL